MLDFAKRLLADFWMTLCEMSPYLLFGFFVAGLLAVLVSRAWVERHLGGRGVWPLIKASILGVPLPLCSCGVIPVSMSLRKHGASKGSTISFLLSTPQTGVDSIFVTFSLLGPLFAIFRPVAAFITGIVGGGIVSLFDKTKPQAEQTVCTDDCCNEDKRTRLIGGLKFAFVTLPRDIGPAMLVGLVIAAFISTLVPDDYFTDKIVHPFLAMVVMMFLGIPVYVCATASVPIAAVLIMKGLNPGAALVFLMTGPATNAASFTTIWKVLGGKTAIIYLLTVAGCALAAGLTIDYLANWFGSEVVTKPHWMLPEPVKIVSAVVLIAVLSYAILFRPRNSESAH